VKLSNPDPLNVGSFIDSTALPFAVVGPAITILPSSVTMGVNSTFPITVSVNQAPTTNISIALTSSDTNVVTVPSPITIQANQTTTTVSVTSTAAIGQNVVVTGSLAGYSSGTTS